MSIKKIRNPQVANKLRQIRLEKYLTQAELGKFLNVTQGAIKNFERGRIPHATILVGYADLGGVTVDWILGREVELKKGLPLLTIANLIKHYEKADFLTREALQILYGQRADKEE